MAHSPAPDQGTDTTRNALYRRITLRLIPFIFICYLFNYLDRVNVGFAKLQMLDALKFSETVYGLGAGIFFIGYVLCGLPSNLALNRFGPRRWIALMMIAWGSLSTCLLFVTTPTEFYTLRLLTGAAEAGFFPGVVLYLSRWFPAARRGRIMALFMSAIPVSGLLGGPFSGWILQHFAAGQHGLAGWQWMFLIQGLPTVALGILAVFLLSDGYQKAPWLSTSERQLIASDLEADAASKPNTTGDSVLAVLTNPLIWTFGFVYFCIQSGVYAINFWLPSIIKNMGRPVHLPDDGVRDHPGAGWQRAGAVAVLRGGEPAPGGDHLRGTAVWRVVGVLGDFLRHPAGDPDQGRAGCLAAAGA